MGSEFWPLPEAFRDLSGVPQLASGGARCVRLAICDASGTPTPVFDHGQEVHFFYEFEIVQSVDGVLAGGLEFEDDGGQVVHGKNSFQYPGLDLPEAVPAGACVRFHQVVRLEVAPGNYDLTLGLAVVDKETLLAYQTGEAGSDDFSSKLHELCRVQRAGDFRVRIEPSGQLRHHGLANMPGRMSVRVDYRAPVKAPVPAPPRRVEPQPTVFHVTHWKAGSQWIYRILKAAAPELIVAPQPGEVQFRHWPLQSGKVYPTVYVTHAEFENVVLPDCWKRFVVIRDLRDTLVSAYFSMKVSHPVTGIGLAQLRHRLNGLSVEDGLLLMMDESLGRCARIQLSWVEAGEPFIRYEDLLENATGILVPLLLESCGLQVSPEHLRRAIESNQFEKLTRGRAPGVEDLSAHERKGVAGDWRTHFTDRLRAAFKARYGGLLIATGYERDLSW